MTLLDRSVHAPGLFTRAWASIRDAVATYMRRRMYRREYWELMRFSDYQLKDIGVTRSDVLFAMRNHRAPPKD